MEPAKNRTGLIFIIIGIIVLIAALVAVYFLIHQRAGPLQRSRRQPAAGG